MKKLLPLLFILIGAAAHAQTQNTAKAFSVGLELGVPTNSIYNVGFGGSGKAEVPITPNLSLSVTAGYINFYYKRSLVGNSQSQDPAGYVPIKAGAKYFLGQYVYVEGEAGTAIETNYSKRNLFAFALGPGFVISTGKHTAVDFGFRYENWGNGRLRQTALRVAYRLGW
jgi:hypothetical protein